MRYPILVTLLALGTVGGLASGLHEAARHHREARAEIERHVAQVCLDAARGAPARGTSSPGDP